MKFLGGMASTTGASYQPIFSLGMQEQARKEKAAQQAVIQQFWLHRTRVEDGKRVVTGYPSLEAMQKRYDEIDGEKWEWERDNDPKFWVGYEPK